MKEFAKKIGLIGISTVLGISANVAHAEDSKGLPSVSIKALSIIDDQTEWLTKTYKDIHEHPELGFMETRTSAIVANELKSLGFEVTTGIAKTGVVAVLKNGKGPTVMYRADMDALAIQEETGLPYASKARARLADGTETPVAHMCGHDAHVTWMLGMARTMVALKSEWSGTIVLIAQPAEEPVSGAKAMLADGLWTKYKLPKPDYFFAVHTTPIPVGMVLNAPGPRMAGTDQFDVLFKGHAGHSSAPHLTKNPINMAANAITQYQTIIGNVVSPQEPAALSVGAIHAGATNNAIPSSATVKMNIRWFKPEVRDDMLESVHAMSDGVAQMQGMEKNELPEISIRSSTPPLINDKALSERLNGPLKTLLGEKKVVNDFPAFMASEDVQNLTGEYKDVPFTFMFVGIANPLTFAAARLKGHQVPYLPHSPNYVVDLKALPMGVKITTVSMLELLNKK